MASTVFSLQQTPLHVAASHGHCNIVEYLVQQGADVSIKDNNGVSVTMLPMNYDLSLSFIATYIPRLHNKDPMFAVCVSVHVRGL